LSAYTETVAAYSTVGASQTLSIAVGTVLTATLTSATPCTFTMPAAIAGKSFLFLLKQPAAGTATTATFTGVKWGSAGAPVITATVGKMDILTFVSDGTNWYGSVAQGYTPECFPPLTSFVPKVVRVNTLLIILSLQEAVEALTEVVVVVDTEHQTKTFLVEQATQSQSVQAVQ
jgi:hypothetical protein